MKKSEVQREPLPGSRTVFAAPAGGRLTDDQRAFVNALIADAKAGVAQIRRDTAPDRRG